MYTIAMTDEEKKKLTWYWDPVEECIWDPRQILQRDAEVQERVTPVSFYDWIHLIEHPVENHHIANIEGANIPGYVENDPISEEETLTNKRAEAVRELESLDYIGVKIATGRATREEYAAEIVRMTELADQINEIDARLDEIR